MEVLSTITEIVRDLLIFIAITWADARLRSGEGRPAADVAYRTGLRQLSNRSHILQNGNWKIGGRDCRPKTRPVRTALRHDRDSVGRA